MNETGAETYVQTTVIKDICVHCGDHMPIVELRDAVTHNVLEVGCVICVDRVMDRKGYRCGL